MVANTPGDALEPTEPVSPDAINGDSPPRPPAEFLADLNGQSESPARPAVRRGGAPQIDFREVRQGTLPGDKYIRVLRAQDQVFKQVAPDYLVAGELIGAPRSILGKFRRA